jgi:hypothetical protein
MRISCLHSPCRTLVFAAVLYLFAPEPAHAQSPSTPPTYLFASIPNGTTSNVAAFSVDPSGTLTPVSGSPFTESHEGGLVSVDPLNQFVFVLNATSSDISVLSIDPTGALAELTAAGSPFTAPMPSFGGRAPTGPTSMATFKGTSANYLYVAYRTGPFPSTGAIVQFQIGTAAQPLIPISTMDFEATPLTIVVSPQGHLYAALQSTPQGNQPSGVGVFAIDPASGALNSESDAAAIHFNEQTLAINPAGTFLFDGWGASTGGVEGSPILADGSAVPNPASTPILLQSLNSPPSAMLVDGTGQLLYVEEHGQAVVCLIDPMTGSLSTLPPSNTQLPLTLSLGNTVADPIEPYLYTLTSGQVHVLRIDLTSGSLAELHGSPYNVGNGSNGLATTNSTSPTISGLAAGLTPSVLNFPDTPVTQPSAPELVHLNNTGTQPLDVTTSAIAITGADQSDFSLTQNCPPLLASPGNCTINITFQPTQSGARQATLIVPDAAGTQSAELLGTGVAQSGVSLAPSALIFATTQISNTAATLSVTLTNSGAATLHISSILVSGQNSPDFAIATGPAESGAPPPCALTSYAPNASCSITIAFSPLGAGARSASINIADDAPGSTQTVLLSGTGTGAPVPQPTAAATLAPNSLAFTSAFVGTPTPQQIVTLTSSGTSPLHVSSIRLTGPNASDFSLTNNCSTSTAYALNQACSISVTFTPSALGTRTASITIASDAANSPQSIPLVGTTTGSPVPQPTATAAATLAPGALTFTSAFVGTPTPQQSVTVTSSGASPLHISSVQLTGPNASDFTLTNDCSISTAYAPNQACSISVSFTPSSLGTRTASIAITSDAANSPQSIALVGSTQSEALTIIPSPTALGVGLSQTVSAGGTASFPLQLVSTFNGTVTFSSCSGAPATAVCTVPTPILVVAHQPATFAITVATVAASSSTNFLDDLEGRRQPPPLTAPVQIFLLILCAAKLRGATARRRTRPFPATHQPSPLSRSLSASATIAALLALSLFTISGCGGASTVATATAVTPTPQSQSYTITITPTATTSDNLPVPNVQPIQLTLVVN